MIMNHQCTDIISALFITGGYLEPQGWETGVTNSVEAWNPVDRVSCSLPNMTRQRDSHTISGGLVCGGPSGVPDEAQESCEVWRAGVGKWEEVVTDLIDPRYYHMSWRNTSGTTFLLGGSSGVAWHVETISQDYKTHREQKLLHERE